MDSVEEIFGVALASSGKKTVTEQPSGTVPSAPMAISPIVPTTEPMCRLASYVQQQFRVNSDHRRMSGVDAKLNKCLLAQTCSYTSEQKDKMRRAGLSEDMYVPITYTKIRAAKAMLMDIFNNAGDAPFSLSPTPDPELPMQVEETVMKTVSDDIKKIFMQLEQLGVEQLPPEMMQSLQDIIVNAISTRYDEIQHRREDEARKRAKRMERKVKDVLAEGGWVDAFQEYVDYICMYGTGIILGPIPRVTAQNAVKTDKKTKTPKFVREYRTIPTFEAVNPCDCYPAPDAKSVDDGPFCIRVKYTSNDLWRYTQSVKGNFSDKANGWIPSTIKALLERFPSGGVKISDVPTDYTRRMAEKNGYDDTFDCTLEGIRCFATVRGSFLMEIGITKNRDGEKIKADDYYQTETIVINGFVVYCRILDERLGRPISKGVFYELPGSWWGEAVAEKLSVVQGLMNNAVKALLQNMAAASGPMYWINDVSRLADRDGMGLRIKPHRMWAFQTSMMGNSGAPMGTISVPSNASELLTVLNQMKQQADDDSGIPAYTYGQTSGSSGAMRTAQGLAIFTEAASRGMKMVISTTDRLVTRNVIKKTADYIMLYDGDLELKGDCEVVPAGIMGKILKAQQDQERMQFLQMVVGNQMLMQIVGVKGVMTLLRPSIQDLAINPDEVLPSEERMRELEKLQQIQQVAQAMQAQQGVQQQQLDQQTQQVQNAQAQQQMQQQAQQPPRPGTVAERRSAA